MTSRHGYRGYIASRPVAGNRTPQHVQNLVVREYAQRRNLAFLLSATELSVPNSFVVLHDVLGALPEIEGIIFYSLFMLPQNGSTRRQILTDIVDAGAVFHAAVEERVVENEAGIEALEKLWQINSLIEDCADPKALALNTDT